MGRRISVGDNHVDNISKQMLAALYARRDDEDPSMQTGELLDACELERHYKITNRVDTHLGPAGLVEDISDEDEPYAFVLTDEGAVFVEEHGLDTPTLDDVREVAKDAHETAESARNSVDQYRKEVHEIRKEAPTLTSIQNEFDEFRTIITRDEDAPSDTWMLENESRIEMLESEIESVKRRQTEIDSSLRNFRASISEFESRLDNVESRVESAEGNASKALEKGGQAIAKVNTLSRAGASRDEQPSPGPARDTRSSGRSEDSYNVPFDDQDDTGWRPSLPSIPLPSWRQVFWLMIFVGLLLLIVFVWWPAAQQGFDPVLP